MLIHEQKAIQDGYKIVVGIDEAGRGPLAGPVVACAVHLRNHQFTCRINDSKKLSPKEREEAFEEIIYNCDFGVGLMTEAIIDEHNILQATFMAMKAAVKDLADNMNMPPDEVCLLVDGNRFQSDLPYAVRTIVGGDSLSLSIACASIIAKVTRDRLLDQYDKMFPQYGFAKHKGYPTKEHKDAIAQHGLSPIHRRTFRHA